MSELQAEDLEEESQGPCPNEMMYINVAIIPQDILIGFEQPEDIYR